MAKDYSGFSSFLQDVVKEQDKKFEALTKEYDATKTQLQKVNQTVEAAAEQLANEVKKTPTPFSSTSTQKGVKQFNVVDLNDILSRKHSLQSGDVVAIPTVLNTGLTMSGGKMQHKHDYEYVGLDSKQQKIIDNMVDHVTSASKITDTFFPYRGPEKNDSGSFGTAFHLLVEAAKKKVVLPFGDTQISLFNKNGEPIKEQQLINFITAFANAKQDVQGNSLQQAENYFDLKSLLSDIRQYKQALTDKNEKLINKYQTQFNNIIKGIYGETTKPYLGQRKPTKIEREQSVSLLVRVGDKNILINGTADEIQTFKDGVVKIADSKTTKFIKPESRLQTSVYSVGMRAQGKKVDKTSQIIHTPNYLTDPNWAPPVEVLDVDNFTDQTLSSILTDYVDLVFGDPNVITAKEKQDVIHHGQQQILFGDNQSPAVYTQNSFQHNLINGSTLGQAVKQYRQKGLNDEDIAKLLLNQMRDLQVDPQFKNVDAKSVHDHLYNLLTTRELGGVKFLYKDPVFDLMRKKIAPDLFGVSDKTIAEQYAYIDPATTTVKSPYSVGGMTAREWLKVLSGTPDTTYKKNLLEQLSQVFQSSFEQNPDATQSQNREKISALRGWYRALGDAMELEQQNAQGLDLSSVNQQYRDFILKKKQDHEKKHPRKPFKVDKKDRFLSWLGSNAPREITDKIGSRLLYNAGLQIEQTLNTTAAWKEIESAMVGDSYIHYEGHDDLKSRETISDKQIAEQIREELVDKEKNKIQERMATRRERLHTPQLERPVRNSNLIKYAHRLANWITNDLVYEEALDSMYGEFLEENPLHKNVPINDFADLMLTDEQKKQYRNAQAARQLFDGFAVSDEKDLLKYLVQQTNFNPDYTLPYYDQDYGVERRAEATDEQANLLNIIKGMVDQGYNGDTKITIGNKNYTLTDYVKNLVVTNKPLYRSERKKQYKNIKAGLPASTLSYFYDSAGKPITLGVDKNKKNRQVLANVNDKQNPYGPGVKRRHLIQDIVKYAIGGTEHKYSNNMIVSLMLKNKNIPGMKEALDKIKSNVNSWVFEASDAGLIDEFNVDYSQYFSSKQWKKFKKDNKDIMDLLNGIIDTDTFLAQKNIPYLAEAQEQEIENYIEGVQLRDKEKDKQQRKNKHERILKKRQERWDQDHPTSVPANTGEGIPGQNNLLNDWIVPEDQKYNDLFEPRKYDTSFTNGENIPTPTFWSDRTTPSTKNISGATKSSKNLAGGNTSYRNTYTGPVTIEQVERLNITAKTPGAVEIKKTGKVEAAQFSVDKVENLIQNFNSNTSENTSKENSNSKSNKEHPQDPERKQKREQEKLKKKQNKALADLENSLLTEEKLKNEIAQRNLRKPHASLLMQNELEAANQLDEFTIRKLQQERSEAGWEDIINDPQKVADAYQKAALTADNYAAAQARLQKEVNPTVWDSLKKSFNGWVKSLTSGALVWTFAAQARRSLQQIVQGAQKLDAVLTDLRIVTGNTREETLGLMTSYSQLGRELSASTSEVASAANSWLRQGYAISEVNDLISASMHLSKLGMIDSGKATEYLAETLRLNQSKFP